MGRLPREVPNEVILRGRIFNAAIPHTFGRPLKFVEQDSNDNNLFHIIEKDDGFEGVIDPKTGKRVSPIVQAVAEFKLRPAVVIQSDEWNQKEKYPYIIVLPIASLYPEDLDDPDIKRMVERNDLPYFHYLASITGRESYITITKPNRLNKNMIYMPKTQIALNRATMEEILKKFATCFEIKKIAQCDTCNKNCEKCEYKLAVNK